MKKATSRVAATDLTPVEQPTASARLEFSVRPTEIRGRAEGTVPARDAPALIKTFGVIGLSVAGITGAAVTLAAALPRDPAWSFGLALAELALAAGAVILIARWGSSPGRHERLTARMSRRDQSRRGLRRGGQS
jgi:hypothetical protein